MPSGSFTYDAWGNETSLTGTATTAFGFTGAYLDPGSGLYYLRARWYDAGTGQFLSLDPDVSSTLAPYQYVDNDPLNASDPSGDVAASLMGGGEGGGSTTKTKPKKSAPKKSTTKSASVETRPQSVISLASATSLTNYMTETDGGQVAWTPAVQAAAPAVTQVSVAVAQFSTTMAEEPLPTESSYVSGVQGLQNQVNSLMSSTLSMMSPTVLQATQEATGVAPQQLVFGTLFDIATELSYGTGGEDDVNPGFTDSLVEDWVSAPVDHNLWENNPIDDEVAMAGNYDDVVRAALEKLKIDVPGIEDDDDADSE